MLGLSEYFYEMIIVIVVIIICVFIGVYWHLHRHFNQFNRLGIRGPRPSLVCGNLSELLNKGQHQALQQWTSQYGRVFGYYEGYTPVISVGEPQLLKQILVKDYPNFKRRKSFPLAPKKSLGLFLEEGNQWRKSRSLLTPAFSTGKMKQMFSIMNECSDLMVANLEDKAESCETFDIYGMFQCLTLDVIGRCAFGLKTDAQTDKDDPFLNQIRTLFNGLTKSIILPLVMFMPFLRYFIFAIKNIVVLFGMNPVVWLRQQLAEVITIRREMGRKSKVVDLVQLMLYPELKKSHQNMDSFMREPMTNREVVAQSMTFLLAGYETTSTGLAFMSHVLAMNPGIQRKLQEEIDEKVGEREIDYESIQSLTYFDQVFDEVCRLYPTASLIVTRRASETKTYEGITIPEGINIQANIWALHRDESYWEEPETFDPDRFSKRRRSEIQGYTYLPFGAGPRACIGMRFAILETKIAIAKVLQKFEIVKGVDMKDVLDVEARGAIVPKDPVNVRVVKRETKTQVELPESCVDVAQEVPGVSKQKSKEKVSIVDKNYTLLDSKDKLDSLDEEIPFLDDELKEDRLGVTEKSKVQLPVVTTNEQEKIMPVTKEDDSQIEVLVLNHPQHVEVEEFGNESTSEVENIDLSEVFDSDLPEEVNSRLPEVVMKHLMTSEDGDVKIENEE